MRRVLRPAQQIMGHFGDEGWNSEDIHCRRPITGTYKTWYFFGWHLRKSRPSKSFARF